MRVNEDFNRIVIVDDNRLLGTDLLDRFNRIDNTRANLLDDLSKVTSQCYHNMDYLFLDYHRDNQMSTVDYLRQIEDSSIYKKIVVYSSYFEKSNLETIKKFDICGYLPRDVDAVFLEQFIHFNKDGKDFDPNLSRVSFSEDFLIVKSKKYYEKLRISDIQYIEVEGKYLFFYTDDKRYIYRDSMKNILLKYSKKFIRIHGKYAINIDHFVKLNYVEQVVHLESFSLPLSKSFRSSLYNYFGLT